MPCRPCDIIIIIIIIIITVEQYLISLSAVVELYYCGSWQYNIIAVALLVIINALRRDQRTAFHSLPLVLSLRSLLEDTSSLLIYFKIKKYIHIHITCTYIHTYMIMIMLLLFAKYSVRVKFTFCSCTQRAKEIQQFSLIHSFIPSFILSFIHSFIPSSKEERKAVFDTNIVLLS